MSILDFESNLPSRILTYVLGDEIAQWCETFSAAIDRGYMNKTRSRIQWSICIMNVRFIDSELSIFRTSAWAELNFECNRALWDSFFFMTFFALTHLIFIAIILFQYKSHGLTTIQILFAARGFLKFEMVQRSRADVKHFFFWKKKQFKLIKNINEKFSASNNINSFYRKTHLAEK